MQQYGCLNPGQVYVSTSGRLPCKKLIHAVGPAWFNGSNSEDVKLYDAVNASMLAAEKLSFSSIAFPAVSCGAKRFPTDRSTSRIICAVKDFFAVREKTCLKMVSLVDPTEFTVREFHKNLGAVFGFHMVDPFDGQESSHQETGKL